MLTEDPRNVWLSQNFRLSDFLGNHSVYSSGYANPFEGGDTHLANATQLCWHALEPAMERFGALSISYGYICPRFSHLTIRYQDPDKPSHHRWDLGAAADIRVHAWVDGGPLPQPDLAQLFMDENTRTSPAALAHALDASDVPYSRLITYSESPFVCVAVSEQEVRDGRPRKAFYENRFAGVPRQKPEYLQMSNAGARARTIRMLQEQGLEHPWRGSGYPTYHGGGRRQYQHTQVSKYTTVLDWLFNMKSISDGVRNQPNLSLEGVMDSMAAAGIVYDYLVQGLGVPRLSILGGFLAKGHPEYESDYCWARAEVIKIELGAPQDSYLDGFVMDVAGLLPDEIRSDTGDFGAVLYLPVDAILDGLIPYN